MATLYVSTTGAGRQDGSSWANASTINNISSLIQKAGPGGEVLLRADQGAYQVNSAITITAGGSNGSPVSIRGVDGAGRDMNAAIVGNRAENWEPGKAQGSEVFRLLDGADNLAFENFAFKNIGNGAFRVGDNISNLSIADVTASNVTRFFENTKSGSATSATIDGLSIKNVDIDGYSLGAIRLRYDTNDVTIENVTADSQRQPGGQYIFGVMLDGTAHDVVLRNVEMKNNYGTASQDKYWNGDGFTTERGVYNVRFENTVATGNTDAGYDLKSENTVLVNAYAEGNSRNYRIWGESTTIQDSVSVNPKVHGGTVGEAHVWLNDFAKAQISDLKIVDNGSTKASLLDLGSYAQVVANNLPADYLSKSVVEKGASVLIKQVAEVPTLPDVPQEPASPEAPRPATPPAEPVPEAPAPTTPPVDTAPEAPSPSPEPTIPTPQPAPQPTAPVPQQPTGTILKGSAAADVIAGGSGNETIVGEGSFDFLSGGQGSDVFVFNDVSDIGNKRYKRDVISDFEHGVDKIDLSGIDANGGAQGNGTFSFIGPDVPFSEAGQLRWAHQRKGSQDVTVIEGEVHGDGAPDFQLELSGHVTITAEDILL